MIVSHDGSFPVAVLVVLHHDPPASGVALHVFHLCQPLFDECPFETPCRVFLRVGVLQGVLVIE